MHNASDLFISISEIHRLLGYGVLFLGMILEGEFILLTAGIIIHLRVLDFWNAFFVALAGVFVGDIWWYYVGFLIKKNRHKKAVTKLAEFFEKRKRFRNLPSSLSQNPMRFIFISKFITGFNNPTLILAGYSKVKFSRFMKAEIFASVIWTFLILALGFLFGYTALSITRKFDKFVLVAVLLIIAFMIFEKQLAKIYYRYRKIID